MITISVIDQIQLFAFWLCFTRVIACFINFPVFEEVTIPMVVKILTALVVSYAIFPIVKFPIIKDISAYGETSYTLLTVYYAISGLVISYIVKIVSSVVLSAGTVMSQQMGLGNISLYDPTSLSPVTPIEKLLKWTLLLMIFSSGALLPILKGMVLSFENLTVLNIEKIKSMQYFFFDYFKSLFTVAIMLSAPVLFTNILLNFILGIISRVVPQINVIMLSFIISVFVGLCVFYMIGEELYAVAFENYIKILGDWFLFVKN
jgi:flagellar biosynthetic protein FliR